MKGFKWKDKRVYRIYRELELNLRIKPRHRLVREKPLPLAVPTTINQNWSMEFMHDQIVDASSIRLFSVIEYFNGEGLGIGVDSRYRPCGQSGHSTEPNGAASQSPFDATTVLNTSAR